MFYTDLTFHPIPTCKKLLFTQDWGWRGTHAFHFLPFDTGTGKEHPDRLVGRTFKCRNLLFPWSFSHLQTLNWPMGNSPSHLLWLPQFSPIFSNWTLSRCSTLTSREALKITEQQGKRCPSKTCFNSSGLQVQFCLLVVQVLLHVAMFRNQLSPSSLSFALLFRGSRPAKEQSLPMASSTVAKHTGLLISLKYRNINRQRLHVRKRNWEMNSTRLWLAFFVRCIRPRSLFAVRTFWCCWPKYKQMKNTGTSTTKREHHSMTHTMRYLKKSHPKELHIHHPSNTSQRRGFLKECSIH